MPQIRQKTNLARVRADDKTRRVQSVMRNGKRLDRHFSRLKTFSGLKHLRVELALRLRLNFFQRQTIAIHRNAQFCGNHLESLNVIAMLVG